MPDGGSYRVDNPSSSASPPHGRVFFTDLTSDDEVAPLLAPSGDKEQRVEVGIRELRNRLSRYVQKVRDGDEVVVTDRGRAVALLVPLTHERTLDRLIAEGLVQPAHRRRSLPRKTVVAEGPVSELVAEQRR